MAKEKVMWLGIGGFFAALIAILTGKKDSSKPMTISMSVQQWEPIVLLYATQKRVNLQFCMAWIQKESGGNPCAWGSAKAKGPDGEPREQGIGQLYNPDDMNRFNIPSGALRVYCVPGTQKCSRKLTSEEIRYQAEKLLDLITYCRERAGGVSAQNHLVWSGKDMYKLTKLWHGLPGLVNGVTRFTAYMKRPPWNWEEYKRAVMSGEVKLDSGTERYRDVFAKVFANAETVASVLPDDVKVVS